MRAQRLEAADMHPLGRVPGAVGEFEAVADDRHRGMALRDGMVERGAHLAADSAQIWKLRKRPGAFLDQRHRHLDQPVARDRRDLARAAGRSARPGMLGAIVAAVIAEAEFGERAQRIVVGAIATRRGTRSGRRAARAQQIARAGDQRALLVERIVDQLEPRRAARHRRPHGAGPIGMEVKLHLLPRRQDRLDDARERVEPEDHRRHRIDEERRLQLVPREKSELIGDAHPGRLERPLDLRRKVAPATWWRHISSVSMVRKTAVIPRGIKSGSEDLVWSRAAFRRHPGLVPGSASPTAAPLAARQTPAQGRGDVLRLPRMVEVVDLLRHRRADPRGLLQILQARAAHRPGGAEMHQQRLLPRRADAGHLVERADAPIALARFARCAPIAKRWTSSRSRWR